jgi:cytochrome b6-f complex iron-sulfur subunit
MERGSTIHHTPGSRRDFLKGALWTGFIAWAAAILYPILSYLKPPKLAGSEVNSIKVMKVSEIKNNEGKIFRFGETPGILIKTKAGEYRAFKATCTHLDCTVQYKDDIEMMWCACHNGKYDVNGRNVSGPPPRPLTPYKVTVQNDEIYVSKT